MLIARRKFLQGFASLLAAPAIVSYAHIMPVKQMLILPDYGFDSFMPPPGTTYQWITKTLGGFPEDTMLDHYLMYVENGWSPVPADRYKNRFATSGDEIVYAGNILMERPAFRTDAARGDDINAAYKLVRDRSERYSDGAAFFDGKNYTESFKV